MDNYVPADNLQEDKRTKQDRLWLNDLHTSDDRKAIWVNTKKINVSTTMACSHSIEINGYAKLSFWPAKSHAYLKDSNGIMKPYSIY